MPGRGLSVKQPQGTGSSSDPDLDALHAFRAGVDGAFDLLVQRHHARVVRLAVRVLGERDVALDVAQEVFVKAWRALPRFEGNSRFLTWLTRIAINQCRNELRKRGTVKHTQPVSLHDPVPGTEQTRDQMLPAATPEPRAMLERNETRQALRDAMAALSPEAREVLVLKEVEALSYEGIAEILTVPVGTVRSRLHRARSELRERIAVVLGAPALWKPCDDCRRPSR